MGIQGYWPARCLFLKMLAKLRHLEGMIQGFRPLELGENLLETGFPTQFF